MEFSEMPGRGEPMFVDVRGAAFAHRILALINWNSLLTVGVAQLGRAPDCGSGGRGFESLRPPQFIFNQLQGISKNAVQ